MNNKEDTGLLKLMRGIEPLELDPELLPEYIESFKSDFSRIGNIGEVEELYSDIPNKERLKTLEIIGKDASYIMWDVDEIPEDESDLDDSWNDPKNYPQFEIDEDNNIEFPR